MKQFRQVEIWTDYQGANLYRLRVIADGAFFRDDHAMRHNVAKVRNQWCEEMAERADLVAASAIPEAYDMGKEEEYETDETDQEAAQF